MAPITVRKGTKRQSARLKEMLARMHWKLLPQAQSRLAFPMKTFRVRIRPAALDAEQRRTARSRFVVWSTRSVILIPKFPPVSITNAPDWDRGDFDCEVIQRWWSSLSCHERLQLRRIPKQLRELG